MELALEVVVLLGGYQLCVQFFSFFDFLMEIPCRLKKKHLSLGNKIMLTSNVLFGISHFMSCLQQFVNFPKLDTILSVQME